MISATLASQADFVADEADWAVDALVLVPTSSATGGGMACAGMARDSIFALTDFTRDGATAAAVRLSNTLLPVVLES
jgi:hypothetical protein